MNLFNLPDLGEGLPDAEISEWHVKVGDEVNVDDPLVSMETAKAVVDVPSPQAGIIAKLFGHNGDVIKTGAPLVGFEVTEQEDAGTVVGNIKSSGQVVDDEFIVGGHKNQSNRPKATPKVKALARKLGIDLSMVTATNANGMISAEDVQQAAHPLQEDYELIKGVRRTMVRTMTESHVQVVPVSIFDDANLSQWDENQDITVRLIQAICRAAQEEPALNAWYDGHNTARKVFVDNVHLGLATDTPDGLFVPVIRGANNCSGEQLRQKINTYKQQVSERAVAPEDLTGSTITLSNFGKFAGRYASPIVVPPSVAILGVGRMRQQAILDETNNVTHQRLLPLSLSFDHRAVTGGEATRFLGVLIDCLQQSKV